MTNTYRLARTASALGILLGLLTSGCVSTNQDQAVAEPVQKNGAFSITLHCAAADQIDESFESGFEPYPASHDFVAVAAAEPAESMAIDPAAQSATDAEMDCNALLENFREGSKLLNLQARYERSKRL